MGDLLSFLKDNVKGKWLALCSITFVSWYALSNVYWLKEHSPAAYQALLIAVRDSGRVFVKDAPWLAVCTFIVVLLYTLFKISAKKAKGESREYYSRPEEVKALGHGLEVIVLQERIPQHLGVGYRRAVTFYNGNEEAIRYLSGSFELYQRNVQVAAINFRRRQISPRTSFRLGPMPIDVDDWYGWDTFRVAIEKMTTDSHVRAGIFINSIRLRRTHFHVLNRCNYFRIPVLKKTCEVTWLLDVWRFKLKPRLWFLLCGYRFYKPEASIPKHHVKRVIVKTYSKSLRRVSGVPAVGRKMLPLYYACLYYFACVVCWCASWVCLPARRAWLKVYARRSAVCLALLTAASIVSITLPYSLWRLAAVAWGLLSIWYQFTQKTLTILFS
jgi:hypothetical protein